MAVISNVMRVKLILFAVICFILWEALRTVPSLSSITNAGPAALDRGGLVSLRTPLSPVEVAVYYEALCPDSRSFITRQLLPAFLKGPGLINPVLIPYGKAETRETPTGYEFTCQHGPVECQGNKVHACAAAIIGSKEMQVKYVACMISNNMNPEEIGERCATKLGIAWDPILQCSRAREGNELLKANGDATYALNPSVSFIPTITLNGNQGNQAAILKNLFGEVCNLYPEPKPAECEYERKPSE
ncbi:gamma-interferon-inducible lysosomal thiol reductase-like isoform X1 [Schistocerca gregaria]|uniref:gamma-interferon-inducible lysosomal thiol reductase-like isoform X1 n=1 Tax=Schistocerca gregaria TaxID=7010 RepID=UPI00211F296B|nr:gamma-interferon-inducible lysosomal thiol reductase-like isoform X1 [Schistocerca gregaria]